MNLSLNRNLARVVTFALYSGVLAFLVEADSATAGQSYNFEGTGAQLAAPMHLTAGTYYVNVRANVNQDESSCVFGAELRGNPAVPAQFSNWGSSIPVAGVPSIRKGIVRVEAGVYQFYVLPGTSCTWDITIFPWVMASASGAVSIVRARIVQDATEQTPQPVTTLQPGHAYTFGVYLEGDPAQIAQASGTLQFVQNGKTLQTVPLIANGVTADGYHFFSREITISPPESQEVYGPITVRFTVHAGSTLTQAVEASVIR